MVSKDDQLSINRAEEIIRRFETREEILLQKDVVSGLHAQELSSVIEDYKRTKSMRSSREVMGYNDLERLLYCARQIISVYDRLNIDGYIGEGNVSSAKQNNELRNQLSKTLKERDEILSKLKDLEDRNKKLQTQFIPLTDTIAVLNRDKKEREDKLGEIEKALRPFSDLHDRFFPKISIDDSKWKDKGSVSSN